MPDLLPSRVPLHSPGTRRPPRVSPPPLRHPGWGPPRRRAVPRGTAPACHASSDRAAAPAGGYRGRVSTPLTCPSCGADVPGGFAFCGRCGTPLASGYGMEERRVVTVLFCDLAGFTARSDRADPEDVWALLRPYHARVRRE
ncbi:MAG TPA: zinc-ribbon domain-containing protein, partial [Actinomycetota bacterium]|nr:zinc-ribbon domain-containing protein [Actinomycetota bacterium]